MLSLFHIHVPIVTYKCVSGYVLYMCLWVCVSASVTIFLLIFYSVCNIVLPLYNTFSNLEKVFGLCHTDAGFPFAYFTSLYMSCSLFIQKYTEPNQMLCSTKALFLVWKIIIVSH